MTRSARDGHVRTRSFDEREIGRLSVLRIPLMEKGSVFSMVFHHFSVNKDNRFLNPADHRLTHVRVCHKIMGKAQADRAHHLSEIGRPPGRTLAILTGQQSAAERRPGRDSQPQGRSHRQELPLRCPLHQAVFKLDVQIFCSALS